MFRIDTLATQSPGSTDNLKLTSFKARHLCKAILLRIKYPVDTGHTFNPAGLSVKTLIASAIGSLTLRYGPNGEKVPFGTVAGKEMRDIARFITRAELPNNISGLGIDGVNLTAQVDLIIPFAIKGLRDGRLRLPGWSQMRTMVVEVVEGAALNYNGGGTNTCVRNAGAKMVIDVDVLTIPSHIDQHAAVLSYFRANANQLEARGPDGVLVGCWDINAGIAAAAYSMVSLQVGGEPVSDSVPVYVPDDQYLSEWHEGSSPIDDDNTIIFAPSDMMLSTQLPCGEVLFRQNQQDTAQIRLRGLQFPVIDSAEATMGALQAANEHKTPVLAHPHDDEATMPRPHARTAPIVIKPSSHEDFTLRAGSMAVPGATEVTPSVPKHVAEQHQAQLALAAQSGPETLAHARSRVAEQVTRAIPGALNHVVSGSAINSAVTATHFETGLSKVGTGAMPIVNRLRSMVASLL